MTSTTSTPLFREERVADACDIGALSETLTDRKVHGILESSHSLPLGVSLRCSSEAHCDMHVELWLTFGFTLVLFDFTSNSILPACVEVLSQRSTLDDPARRTLHERGFCPHHQYLSPQRGASGRCLRC